MNWMAWTVPTALFFCAIGLLLFTMTLIELKRPTTVARGWLPMATTRGDRVFISLLAAAALHVAWLSVFTSPPYMASVAAVITAIIVLRWG